MLVYVSVCVCVCMCVALLAIDSHAFYIWIVNH